MNAKELDQALNAYLECALWSSLDWDALDNEDDNPDPMDTNYDISDFAPEFVTLAERELCEAWDTAQLLQGSEWWTPEQFGHDFWLTRNGHGAGFWDRGQGRVGDLLSDMAGSYGAIDLYVFDGKVRS